MADQKFLSDLVAELGKLNKDDLATLLQGMTANKQGIATLRAEVDALKGSQSDTPNLYVVASGKSGDTFWKKYNNGLIEQFGWVAPAINSNPKIVAVTFPLSFSKQPRLLVTKHAITYEKDRPGNLNTTEMIPESECGYHLKTTGFTVIQGQTYKSSGYSYATDCDGTDWYAIGF